MKLRPDTADRVTARRIVGGTVLLAAVTWLLTGFVTVEPGEVGVLIRFGKPAERELGAGLHYALPYPFHRVETVSLSRISTVEIGAETPIAAWVTGDLNVINVRMMANYRIQNSRAYLFRGIENPEQIVRGAVDAALNRTLNRLTVDEALTSKKTELELRVKDLAQEILDLHESGVALLSTRIRETRPPAQVAGAFREVMDARSSMHQIINEAETNAQMKRSRARTQAYEGINEARAYADKRVKLAKAKTESIARLINSGQRAALKYRLHKDTLKAVLPDVRKIILGPGAKRKVRVIR